MINVSLNSILVDLMLGSKLPDCLDFSMLARNSAHLSSSVCLVFAAFHQIKKNSEKD